MKSKSIENIIIVKEATRLEKLTEKYNTIQQAAFHIEKQRSAFFAASPKMKKRSAKKSSIPVMKSQMNNMMQEQSAEDDFFDSGFEEELDLEAIEEESKKEVEDYRKEHEKFKDSLSTLKKELSNVVKTKVIDKNHVSRYIFDENDLVVVIGRDGLVANTAKYVNNIPIIGVNPDVSRYDGILLPYNTENFMDAVDNVLRNSYDHRLVSMAEAKSNDGQRLLAFNDFFIGANSHISARYIINFGEMSEFHSSSGIIVSTPAGSTGWLSSMINMANGINQSFGNINQPVGQQTMSWEEEKLVFVVREPFVSKHSYANIVAGSFASNKSLQIESQMPENGLIFSDGIESDYIAFNSGTIATIGIAPEKAKLVT